MKKLISGFITVAALLTLAACGNGGSSSTDSSKKGDQNQLEAIKSAGVLNVATSADFAPFEFHALIDGKDQIVGAVQCCSNCIEPRKSGYCGFWDLSN